MQLHCCSVGKGSSLGVSQTLANSLSICDDGILDVRPGKAYVVAGKIGGN